MTPLQQVGGIAAILAIACTATVWVAPRSAVEAVDQRVTQLIQEDMRKAALQRMWLLEARYGGQVCCAGWNATDIALWKDAKAEYDKTVTKLKKEDG